MSLRSRQHVVYVLVLVWLAYGAAFFYAGTVRAVLYPLPFRDLASSFTFGSLIAGMAISTIYSWNKET